MAESGAGASVPMHASGVGAVVLGGAHGALAVIRSLGRQGIPVWYASNDQLIAKFSRYATRFLPWPGADHPDAVTWLSRLAKENGLDGWVLFPAADAEARLVSQGHAELSKIYRLTTPPADVTRWAFDKRLTNERATSLGLDIPWSRYPCGRADVARLDAPFPLILKPTVHESRNAFTAAKAWRVDDRAELIARYDQAVSLVGEQAIVLQELIPGRGSAQLSYAGLWDRGQPVASLVARRTRQFPIDFGYTSTYVQTVENDEVEKAAYRLLRSLDYDGLVEVEFKYDSRDNRYKILDINARAWTWIGLGSIAGTDFPYLQWRLATGETVPRLRGAAGVAWMHLSRDVVAACQEIALGGLSLRHYLDSFRQPMTFAAYAADDVAPGLVDLPLVSWRVLTMRLPAMFASHGGPPTIGGCKPHASR